ncbi:hypothetical protein NHX12_030346 [Muraenolepis orangiensis]|uniref:RRM domain-containing protein n=1 Tax=Muraenolepis orangiensis TaxID=630683 RepID=A0A9Q0E9M8_9TELE|nr:hypothetical protein NHX12_030346 [Muraenolepis orangiensis]
MLLHPLMNGALELLHPGGTQKDTTFTKMFVGGLPYHTNDASLRKYFESYGDIDEAVVITDRQTGKSRGYGFVTMADRGSADRACKDPNPIIDGRKANVNLAYLGAKPRSMQTGEEHAGISIGVQPIHPALVQRQYGGISQPSRVSLVSHDPEGRKGRPIVPTMPLWNNNLDRTPVSSPSADHTPPHVTLPPFLPSQLSRTSWARVAMSSACRGGGLVPKFQEEEMEACFFGGLAGFAVVAAWGAVKFSRVSVGKGWLQYLYPQAFMQPSLMLPSQVSGSLGSLGSSPYLDYNTAAAYSQYAQAAFDQHYPYAPSPASFLGYTYAPGSGSGSTAAAATASLAAMHAGLASSGAAGQSQAFLHYPPQQHVQPERMQ